MEVYKNLFVVDYFEGHHSGMQNYHTHTYYEISLILEGEIRLLLPRNTQHGREYRLLLTAPGTPHCVACNKDFLYRRHNVVFTEDFIRTHTDNSKLLQEVFGKNGRIVILNETQKEQLLAVVHQLEADENVFRRKLRLLLLLSYISEFSSQSIGHITRFPDYITEAMQYLNTHSDQKINTSDLAYDLGIGRTTLMTKFKLYTGMTIGEYLTSCRINKAVSCLLDGNTQQVVAEKCGFGDACNLIRCFRKYLGTTPYKYISVDRAEMDADMGHKL